MKRSRQVLIALMVASMLSLNMVCAFGSDEDALTDTDGASITQTQTEAGALADENAGPADQQSAQEQNSDSNSDASQDASSPNGQEGQGNQESQDSQNQNSNGVQISEGDDDQTEYKGYMAQYVYGVKNAKVNVAKKWEGKERGEEVIIKIKWKLNPSEDIETLHKAITVKGVDEATIIEILTKYAQIPSSERQTLIDVLNQAYLDVKGKPLDEVLKKALVGHLEGAMLDILANKDDARISQNVHVDSDGYCYILVKVEKKNG